MMRANTQAEISHSSTATPQTRADAQGENAASSAAIPKTFKGDFVDVFAKLCRNEGSSSNDMRLFMSTYDEFPRLVWQNVLLSFHFWHERRSKRDKRYDILKALKSVIEGYPDIFQRELLQDYLHSETEQKGDRYDGALHAAVLWPGTGLRNLLVDPHSEGSRTSIFDRMTLSEPESAVGAYHFVRRARLWRARSQSAEEYRNVAKVMEMVAEFVKGKAPDLNVGTWDRWDIARSEVSLFLIGEDDSNNWWEREVKAEALLAWAAAADQGHILVDIWHCDGFGAIFESVYNGHQMEFRSSLNRASHGERQPASRIAKLLAQRKQAGLPRDVKRDFLDRLSKRTPGNRWTPLHLAAARGYINMVKFLQNKCDGCLRSLKVKADKDKYTEILATGFYDAKFMTPLHYAVLGNHKDVVKILVNWEMFKPHVNACDVFMRTAFQIACSKEERNEIAKSLFEYKGVDAGGKDCCSFTALHWAVYSGSESVARLLIASEVAHCEGGMVSLIKTCAKTNRSMQTRLLNLPPMQEEIQRLYRDRQVYVDAANAILVGATLIASVTFGGWLQPPLGTNRKGTMAVHLFWACNNLSFFFAIATVIAGANTVLPVGYDNMEDAVQTIKNWLIWTSFLLILSVVSVLGAFAAAGFAALVGIRHLKENMIVTTSFGSVVCMIVGTIYCYRLFCVIPDVKEILECITIVMQQVQKKAKSVFQPELSQIKLQSGQPSDVKQHPGQLGDVKQHPGQPGDVVLSVQKFSRIKQQPDQPGDVLQFVKNIIQTQEFQTKVAGVYKSGSDPEDLNRERKKVLRDLWAAHHRQECSIRTCYLELEKDCLLDISMLQGINNEADFEQYVVMWDDIVSRLPVEVKREA